MRTLGEGGQVDVVLKGHVGPQFLAHRLHEAVTPPTRQVRCHGDVTPRRIEDARAPQRGVRDLRPVDSGFARQPVSDGADLPDQRRSARDLRPLVASRHQRAGNVGDRGPHPLAPDVDADHPAGGRVELVEDRRGPALTMGAPDLAHQRRLQQPGEGEGDRRLGEPADAGDLGPREGTTPVDEVEHRALVDGPEQAGRAGRDGDVRLPRPVHGGPPQ